MGGVVRAEATVPLGDFQRPDWLWPEAPGGKGRLTADASDFHLQPFLQALGEDENDIDVSASLRVSAEWDPQQPALPRALVEADDLRISLSAGDLVAEGPLQAMVHGKRFELAPLVLVGLGSRIEASATFDPTTQLVTGRLETELSPAVTRVLPLPIRTDGLVRVTADLTAPAVLAPTFESIQGQISVDHRGGTMVMRDPPLEIRNLNLRASIDDGIVNIGGGSAEVNRGLVESAAVGTRGPDRESFSSSKT